MNPSFISAYLQYVSGGESPTAAHRWSAISMIGAALERNCWVEFGPDDIYPNMYAMIIGVPGTRKSTAIKAAKRVLKASGYSTFSAEKTSKEKFIADLASPNTMGQDDTDLALFGDQSDRVYTPLYVVADEANDFFGINNMEFLSLLGSFWDWKGDWENRTKTSKCDVVPNPTISILGGNTAAGFSMAFPPAILSQGFFSRMLLIYAEPTGKKILFPRRATQEETEAIVKLLNIIKQQSTGPYKFTPDAEVLANIIYETTPSVTDPRFESYSSRRLTHLLKLCLIVAASNLKREIDYDTVLEANTYLTYAEQLMPKALGEFGKARNSDVTHKVLQLMDSATVPMDVLDIWKHVSSELEALKDLVAIIQNLNAAGKLQSIPGKGFLILKQEMNTVAADTGLVDFKRFLTEEELNVKH